MTEQFEGALEAWLRSVGDRHGVYTVVELTRALEPEASFEWREEIAAAAVDVSANGMPATVRSAAGSVTLNPGEAPVGVATFNGVPRERDLSFRLRKLVLEKARQTSGPYPTWVRVDGLDGVFAFTAWSQATPTQRIAELASLLVEPLGAYPHVHGVVYSSGMAGGGYGVAPETLIAGVDTSQGHFVRRSLATFLLRETVVLPVRPYGLELATAWAAAYGSEPQWLDDDLTARDLPPLAQLRV
jgi:hypothetical protein